MMKKADLVNELAKFTAITVEIFLNLIKKILKKRKEIFLSGFGTFSAVKRKARTGRNPRTGDKIMYVFSLNQTNSVE